jgi:protein TonB
MLALWLSIALHAAIIGLVRVTPRTVVVMDQVLEARLESPLPPQAEPNMAEVPLLDSRPEAQMLISVADELPLVIQPLPEIKSDAKPQAAPPPAAVTTVTEQVMPNNPEPAKKPSGPSIDIPLAVDTHYYAAKELDVQPRPVRKVEPSYPAEYEVEDISGYVVLEMRVEEDGQVSDLEVVEISPASREAFGREALEAFHDVRFIPAKRKGQQVRALFRVRVVFESADSAR